MMTLLHLQLSNFPPERQEVEITTERMSVHLITTINEKVSSLKFSVFILKSITDILITVQRDFYYQKTFNSSFIGRRDVFCGII